MRLFGTLFLLLMLPLSIQAAELKFGYIDLKEVITKSKRDGFVDGWAADGQAAEGRARQGTGLPSQRPLLQVPVRARGPKDSLSAH